ncbi:Efflux pump membrane transporter BepE [Rubripirellula amarantea]|uniref:Efflux pump membrane transporter BepE n=1 Tax=Rubripirellula amarantea TaxID=2527999 RepID=A0A5C5WFI6_9BACT|nr:efflux RND transporter permease subunit [Rubripirellula amarantea]TWT49297.1 Efflux pump membrane transporter BepE [Rubripirellula amarantea]
MTHHKHPEDGHDDVLSGIVRVFLNSNLSIILIVFSLIIGVAALLITPREEDPQIVVPLADIFVEYPGHSAAEVEQLVSTPLERMLYQIDGVEYVYSMSMDDRAIVTVRFYVGQDRERSLVKLFKKLNENTDAMAPGITDWVMKPVEIDDVPIVTFALKGAEQNGFTLRRIGEELVERLGGVSQVNRAYVVGGQSRTITVALDPEGLRSHGMTALEVLKTVEGANRSLPAGSITHNDHVIAVRTDGMIASAAQLRDVVVGVFDARPVFLKDVASVNDGAEEVNQYVRHGWGPSRGFDSHWGNPGTVLGEEHSEKAMVPTPSSTAVTIAISKQKGANAVRVADAVIERASQLREQFVPDNVEMVITRNSGQTANHKVNELVEALGVAIVIVVLLLTIGLGFREAMIVAVAVPVVFGLTLAVNLMFGYTINRVTLFALILSLGLLVDDPIVDVENIARHFHERKKATRRIVLDAVAEIRPPLISATLAVIVSFLPMFFITGMMGPYMSPMALNVPVAMLMSMVVAFTITPWLTYQVLKKKFPNEESGLDGDHQVDDEDLTLSHASYDPEQIKTTLLYRFFRPMMVPLLKTRFRAVMFLALMAVLTVAAAGLGALRMVPLKMLPFDNKNEFLVMLDMPEGTSLERTDAVMGQIERFVASEPEVTDYTSYVGLSGPIDFNGMVRHYYLRGMPHQAELRVNLVGKKNRHLQSHGIGLRMHDALTDIAESSGGNLRIVELPPGPPVLASLVAEVTGQAGSSYDQILSAADIVAQRMRREPGVFEVDTMREVASDRLTFVPDQEKSAIAGVSVDAIAQTIAVALGGDRDQTIRVEGERVPLRLTFQLPKPLRSSPHDLSQLTVKGTRGNTVLLAELGAWNQEQVSQTIYHKNLQRIAYVMAECAGRPPAECVVDVLSDQQRDTDTGFVADTSAIPVSDRSYFSNGGGVAWGIPSDLSVTFSGEGEWKITLDVFRDLGLAFAAAMVMIYIILVAQTGSFVIPTIVMLAIPLTILGVMPGFYALNLFANANVGGYPDPIFFTATAMIGMIALAGIVTRDSIILVDFMEQAVAAGRPLFDAILESRVIRLRPILLTASAALLSAVPITLDPIFSGLGWSLIFGLIASTLFTLFVIPATYWLIYHKPAT